jgi:hypothetical protein
MRSSRLLECLPVNAGVAIVIGSIPASSNTAESEEAADEAVWNKVLNNPKQSPLLSKQPTKDGVEG